MDTITDMTTLTHIDKNKNTISTSYTLYRIADDVK